MPDVARLYEECKLISGYVLERLQSGGITQAYEAFKRACYDLSTGAVVVDSRLIENNLF